MYSIHPDDESGGLATDRDSCLEYARNAGMDNPDRAWINTPQDTWERNPFYHGPAVPHPEADEYEYEGAEGRDTPQTYTVAEDGEIPF